VIENFSYELFKIQVNRHNVKLVAETLHTKGKSRIGWWSMEWI